MHGAAVSGAAASGGLLARLGYAQAAAGSARIVIDVEHRRGDIDRNLFGSFLEHLGRAIYGGVYEPGSSLADANGFRRDVAEQVRGLGVPIMRYPGGNFVSGYNWLDGVGPKSERPEVIDRAWNTLETNQFGTNEFIDWCRLIGSEPLLAVNLGTGTPESAAALVEYCNLEKGARWAALRREHGYDKPHGVKHWCLGNEMDGWWQIGRLTAIEYGRKARDAARQMRAIDRDLQLIACGSSATTMPTYLEWDRQVLEECYREVDGLSLHLYVGNSDNDAGRYLAANLDMERQILDTVAVVDYVRALLRSPKRLWLSFDEWNVWYRARGGEHADGRKQPAPKLLEEIYNLEDALVVGGMLNTLIRQAERVRVGCLAQIVNVIAPLFTNKDQVLRQPIFYPYAWALAHAKGAALDLRVETETYQIDRTYSDGYRGGALARTEPVPMLDVSATYDEGDGSCALFLLNRELDKEREVALEWQGAAPVRTLGFETLTGPDLKAANSFDQPERVKPEGLEIPAAGSRMTLKLPPRSHSVLRVVVA